MIRCADCNKCERVSIGFDVSKALYMCFDTEKRQITETSNFTQDHPDWCTYIGQQSLWLKTCKDIGKQVYSKQKQKNIA